MDPQPTEARRDPETRAVAVQMASNVTAYRWFVIDPANGGHPVADGSPEIDAITAWPLLVEAAE